MKRNGTQQRKLLAKVVAKTTTFAVCGILFASLIGSTSGCGTMRSVLALRNGERDDSRPIQNPFGAVYSDVAPESDQRMILRSKKGDRSIEIEIPKADQQVSELVIPVSPNFSSTGRDGRGPASISTTMADDPMESGIDETYKDHTPTISDREITRSFQSSSADEDPRRQEIERGLALVTPPDSVPTADQSYLAGLDRIKQLYRKMRFEAALIETDELIKRYQTSARLYEMQGTLLDRLGKPELALRSWQQALRLDPNNSSLKKFIERKIARTNARAP